MEVYTSSTGTCRSFLRGNSLAQLDVEDPVGHDVSEVDFEYDARVRLDRLRLHTEPTASHRTPHCQRRLLVRGTRTLSFCTTK